MEKRVELFIKFSDSLRAIYEYTDQGVYIYMYMVHSTVPSVAQYTTHKTTTRIASLEIYQNFGFAQLFVVVAVAVVADFTEHK